MPLTDKGNKILSAMEEKYGDKKGEQVFYASENKGKLQGIHKYKRLCGSLKRHGLSKNHSK